MLAGSIVPVPASVAIDATGKLAGCVAVKVALSGAGGEGLLNVIVAVCGPDRAPGSNCT
jgi:hypothetical protein